MIQCQAGTKPWFRTDPVFSQLSAKNIDWVSPLLIPELIPIFLDIKFDISDSLRNWVFLILNTWVGYMNNPQV
jgi:hypothetical protein